MHAEKGYFYINKVWVWQVFHILVSNIFFSFVLNVFGSYISFKEGDTPLFAILTDSLYNSLLSFYVFFLPIGFNLINRCLCAVDWTWKLFVCDI